MLELTFEPEAVWLQSFTSVNKLYSLLQMVTKRMSVIKTNSFRMSERGIEVIRFHFYPYLWVCLKDRDWHQVWHILGHPRNSSFIAPLIENIPVHSVIKPTTNLTHFYGFELSPGQTLYCTCGLDTTLSWHP